MADYLLLEGDNAEAILQNNYEQVVQGYHGDETLDGIQVVIDEIALENVASLALTPENVVDLSILEEAMADGR